MNEPRAHQKELEGDQRKQEQDSKACRLVKRARVKPSPVRKTALQILAQAESDLADVGDLLNAAQAEGMRDARDRGLLMELVYGVLRQRGLLDAHIDAVCRVRSLPPALRHLLRLGLYQLLFLDRIPPFAAVSTAVDLAKEIGGAGAGRLVNALLRNVLRNTSALPLPDPIREPIRHIAIAHSHPEWLVARWMRRWGTEKTIALCQHNNTPPPVTLRVNALKTDRATLAAQWTLEGVTVQPTPHAPDGLYVSGVSVAALSAFNSGAFYAQDEGAQLISYLVDPQPGETILDFCAAPGGKTTHLAERMGGRGRVVATDVSQERCVRLRENVMRLGTPGVSVVSPEAALAGYYDRILIDAPCSALGVLRRVPEGKWNKTEGLIADFAQTQIRILLQVAPRLRPGGRLVYATCSTEEEENARVVAALSAACPDMTLECPTESLPASARQFVNARGFFTTAFNASKMDVFFAARWVKIAP